jgi:hypothetical protein
MHASRYVFSFGAALSLLVLVGRPALADTGDAARFFETSIRPLLENKCRKCHSAQNLSSGFRVDSLAALKKGGTRGSAIAAGDPEHSLLLSVVKRGPGVPAMPPNEKLSEGEVRDLERWIKDGAFWPEVAPAGTGKHWAFEPVRRPLIPSVKNRAWVRTPVDAFILAQLEAKGLKPAPPADRRTLIRRATFDLTGLPPTPAETEAFVKDKAPNAWEKVIDRLLASPQYGERWGRHWLDVARYADTNGMDENVHYGNAFRYRDWVVSCFNRDEPYNQFLVEQIAGDLLQHRDDQQRREHLIATGFLAIGPKVISEVDDRKMEMDMIDEQVDTLGRTTMGLTLGCARCHDHKFDPISTKDYYALAGIFKSTKTMEVMKKPRMWFEYPLATEADLARKAESDKRIAAAKAEISTLVARETETLKKSGTPMPKSPETAFPKEIQDELKRMREAEAELEKNAPEMPAAMGLTEAKPVDLPVHIRGDFLNLGEMVPRHFPTVLVGNAHPPLDRTHSGRLELAQWITNPEHPLTPRVIANRIWRWHFGQGLVRTTDNFGLLGEKPSNPELLDWLARRFMDDGWSFKKAHKLLMLSSAYTMSSAYNPAAAEMDPENRLHWRFDIRRLEAEEIRDSLLAVSGTLDLTMGGTIFPLKNREYVFDHTSKDNTKYVTHRRSIYIPIVRNHLYDVFQLFDFGDGAVPDGNRATTTVAPQALFIMNSAVVSDASTALASKLLERTDLDADGKIDLLYQQAYNRPATSAETARARTLLTRFQSAQPAGTQPPVREKQAWTWLAHTALSANEFLFLR